MRPARGVEALYRERIDRMSIAERVQRSADLFAWSRDFVCRQLIAGDGTLSGDRMKWEMALRQYGSDPTARSMIERMLARASR